MEPIAALGVAAATLQFFDFVRPLVSNTISAYKTGETTGTLDLADVAKDLQRYAGLVSQMAVKMSEGGLDDGLYELLADACGVCKMLGDELEKSVETLRVGGTTRLDLAKNSFLAALKGWRDVGNLERMERRIADAIRGVQCAVMICLCEASWRQGKAVESVLDQQNALLKQSDLGTDLGSEVGRLVLKSEDTLKNRRTLARDAWHSGWNPSHDAQPKDQHRLELVPPKRTLSTLTYGTLKPPLLREVLKDLRAGGVRGLRENAIEDVYPETYEWVFSSEEGALSWDSFPEWLAGDSKAPYWITGKPGSGKSTLVKFIATHPSLGPCLKRWSGEVPALVATFYAWSAGAEPQKSATGFICAVLSHCVEQMPGLVDRLFPRRRALHEVFGVVCSGINDFLSRESVENHDLSLADEVWHAFELLFSEACGLGQEYNVLLLVDGLDEFRDKDHESMVAHIKKLGALDGVKVCVSSRPWNIFVDAYERSPSLTLQDFTRNDISRFVTSTLQEQPGFRELRDVYSLEADRLAKTVVEKAQGVFLWVSLVVKTLIAQLSNGDTLSNLQASIDALPGDINNLYQCIWNGVEARYKPQGAQYFAFRRQWTLTAYSLFSNLSLSTDILWLADEREPFDLRFTDRDHLHTKASARRRLASRTKGLLEVKEETGEIDYIHRTAFEWFNTRWLQIEASIPSGFDASLELLKACSIYFFLDDASDQLRQRKQIDRVRFCLALATAATGASAVNSTARCTRYLGHVDDRVGGYVKMNSVTRCRCMNIGPRFSGKRVEFLALAAAVGLWEYVVERLGTVRAPPAFGANDVTGGPYSLLEVVAIDDSARCLRSGMRVAMYSTPAAFASPENRQSTLRWLVESGYNPVGKCHSDRTLVEQLQELLDLSTVRSEKAYFKAALAILEKPKISQRLFLGNLLARLGVGRRK